MTTATNPSLRLAGCPQPGLVAASLPATAGVEPWVDVLIPVRNGGPLLADAIASVLRQTMPRFRLVVVNNNSTDETAAVARSFADPRIEVIDLPVTKSLFENFNFCVSQVRAPFFCILHADDRLLPAYLEEMVPHLRNRPGLQVAACQVRTIDAQGQAVLNFKYQLKNWLFLSAGRTMQAEDISGRLLVAFNFMVAPSLFYRREVLEMIGTFREDMAFLSDLEYLDRGLRRGAGYLIVPRVLFEYRLHAEQATSNLTRNLYKYTETYRYFSEEVPVHAGTRRRRGRLGPEAAEARVAVVVLWDYITTKGPGAPAFRNALVHHLLTTPILGKYRWLWRLLEVRGGSSPLARRLLCLAAIAGLLVPLIGWGLFH